jgi:DNA-binding CsgD family transcriptional regulator
LTFVARRLVADGIGMVFCVRDPVANPEVFAGLPELPLGGLPERDCLAVLKRQSAVIDREVARRIVAVSHGNPLALTEFARALTAAQLRGDDLVVEPLPLEGRIEAHYREQVTARGAAAQTVLLLAAAEPSGDSALLWRAAMLLGVEEQHAAVIEDEVAEFVRLRPDVVFRHPLIRSAIYGGALPSRRRQAHDALARATNGVVDPDRRSWHLAAAAIGPDEQVALRLEGSAERARARGGYCAESAFLSRAAELTPDDGRRGVRLLKAAEAALSGSDYRRCEALLVQAQPLAASPLTLARLQRIRGAVLAFIGRNAEGPALLAAAARALEPFDVQLSRDTWLGALSVGWLALGYAQGITLRDVAASALAVRKSEAVQETINDLLLDGIATRIAVGYAEAAPVLRRAIAERDGVEPLPPAGVALQPLLVHIASVELWDLHGGRALLRRMADRDRARGASLGLWLSLLTLSHKEAWAGRFAASEAYFDEATVIGDAIGLDPAATNQHIEPAALRGRDEDVRESVATVLRMAEAGSLGSSVTGCRMALTLLGNGRGRYQDAFTPAKQIFDEDAPGFGSQVLPELVEAASRVDELDVARAALRRLRVRAMASGTDAARGLLARSQALLAPHDQAEAHHTKAISLLARTDMSVDQARAHLLYGEWLAGQRRQTDAVVQLHTARRMFDSMGAEGFAERARGGLLAVGARAGRRATTEPDELTQQEAQVARLAKDGLTNREIATTLFISENTVAYHLRKVYRKLDVTSRRELARQVDPAVSARRRPGT